MSNKTITIDINLFKALINKYLQYQSPNGTQEERDELISLYIKEAQCKKEDDEDV